MLGINWSDVMNVIMSVLPQLIVIGVVLVLAIIVTVAVNKKTVADTATGGGDVLLDSGVLVL